MERERKGRKSGRKSLAAVVALLAVLLGCGPDEGRRSGSGEPADPVRDRDSLRAVQLAAREYVRHSPGIPVRVRGFRREGDEFVVTFHPGVDWVGGGGVIRVKPDGSTRVEDLTQ